MRGLAVMLLAAVVPAAADIVGVDGGKTDCYGGFDLLSGATSCVDGNPQCDADGVRNGECVFQLRACVGVRGIRGCHPGRIRRVDAKAYQSRPPTHVRRPTIPVPAVPTRHQACGDAAAVPVPLGLRGQKLTPGRRRVRLHAVGTRGRSDVDQSALTCTPSSILCFSAPGPAELDLAFFPAGSDLQIGASHYVPVADDTRLSACLDGCDKSNISTCTVLPSALKLISGVRRVDLPPIPLLANGVPICLQTKLVVDRTFDPNEALTAVVFADVVTGAVDANVMLVFDAAITDPAAICPRCIVADDTGVGLCDGGVDTGAACKIDQIETVHADSGDMVFPVSRSCSAAGEKISATVATRLTTDALVDCPLDPAHCAGITVPPTPPWPDPTYPKTAAGMRLVATACIPPLARADGSTIEIPCPLGFAFAVAESWLH